MMTVRGRIFPSMNVANGPPVAVDLFRICTHCYSRARRPSCRSMSHGDSGSRRASPYALNIHGSNMPLRRAIRGSRHHPINDLRRPSGCVKNAVLLVPGYVVTKFVSVESSLSFKLPKPIHPVFRTHLMSHAASPHSRERILRR